jgi:hypothetical protein
MKKTTLWDDGTKVLPVDQVEGPLRESFSKDIHGKTMVAVKNYWNQVIFSGLGVPPPVKASDPEVLAYVKANPGAVGYVSATAPITEVKVLRVEP